MKSKFNNRSHNMIDQLPTAPLDVALSFVEDALKTGAEISNGLLGLDDVRIHIYQKDLAIARLTQQLIVALDVLIERGAAVGADDTEYRAQWHALTGREWWKYGEAIE